MQAHIDSPGALVQSTLPKPWEQETTFHDVLYEWMGRAPWLMISAAAHLLVFFILMAIPWDMLRRQEDPGILATIEAPPEELFDEPLPEEEPPIVEDEHVEEPQLQDANEDLDEPPIDVEHLVGDPLESVDAPFEDAFADNDILGIGGNVGRGKYGNRGLGKGRGPKPGGGIHKALLAGLEWLTEHQSDDGSWDCDGFSAECGGIGSTTCGGPGYAGHDVGVTGLALLALLGAGNTLDEGLYQASVRSGVMWLRSQQDPDTGLIGDMGGHEFLYDHSLATLALCEAYYFSQSPLLKGTAQRAVDYVQRARNPYAAWRYDVPPIGDNDTSVTGWMLFALSAARDAGLVVDEPALEGGLSWIDEVTDPATGRVGYDSFGVLSSRTPANEHFPREKGEAMTAVGLLCRVFLGQDPKEHPVMEKHADLLLRTPPVWDPEGFGCDMYYWYYGTYAMFQMGRPWWEDWRRAMERAVLGSQRKDGDEAGSWDPVGPWGYAGGRVYSTALMSLCLEVYFRYGKLLGDR